MHSTESDGGRALACKSMCALPSILLLGLPSVRVSAAQGEDLLGLPRQKGLRDQGMQATASWLPPKPDLDRAHLFCLQPAPCPSWSLTAEALGAAPPGSFHSL